jgi:hypothetical protein
MKYTVMRSTVACVALALTFAACSSSSKPAANSPAVGSTTGSTSAASSTSASAASSSTSAGAASSLPSGSFDFCRLITQDEAQAAVGKPVKVGIRSSQQSPLGPVGGCVYGSTDTTQTSRTLVNVVFLGNKLTRALFDQQVSAKVGSAAKPVAGIGEKAIYFTGIIAVFDHGIALTVQTVKDNVPGTEAVLTVLAHKALDRTSQVQ